MLLCYNRIMCYWLVLKTCNSIGNIIRAAKCYWISVFCYWNYAFVTEIFMKFWPKYWNLAWFSSCFHTKILKFVQNCAKILKLLQFVTEVNYQRLAALHNGVKSRDHFVYVPSQWEMMLHCVVSHWLGTCTEWSLEVSIMLTHLHVPPLGVWIFNYKLEKNIPFYCLLHREFSRYLISVSLLQTFWVEPSAVACWYRSLWIHAV